MKIPLVTTYEYMDPIVKVNCSKKIMILNKKNGNKIKYNTSIPTLPNDLGDKNMYS